MKPASMSERQYLYADRRQVYRSLISTIELTIIDNQIDNNCLKNLK